MAFKQACMHPYAQAAEWNIYLSIRIYLSKSFIAVAVNIRDQYKIIGLHEISQFIKQPFRNVCPEKAL